MPKAGIVMGSDSDFKVMKKALDILKEFGVETEVRVISAHREPEIFFDYAKSAESRGLKVIIAGAGMAAHLPGMCAALFPLPVIGVPISSGGLGGQVALYSILQMPAGIPVATVAIDGAKNAGLLAVRMLAMEHDLLREKLKRYSEDMCKAVEEKDRKLQESLKEA